MLLTLDVSHELRSWLNDEAPWNTAYKLVTDSVLHPSGSRGQGWLKLVGEGEHATHAGYCTGVPKVADVAVE